MFTARLSLLLVGLFSFANSNLCFAAPASTLAPVLETKAFRLEFASDGRPFSFKVLGEELIDPAEPGKGFEIYGLMDLEREAPERLTKITRTADNKLVVASENGTQRITFGISEHDSHVALRIERVEGVSISMRLKLRFDLRIKAKGIVGQAITTVRNEKLGVGVQALDYMTIAGIGDDGNGTRLTMNWPYLFHRAADDPLGGFVIFACPGAQTLETIGQLELEEGLPHPMLAGQWGKVNNWPSRLCQFVLVFNKREDLPEVENYVAASGLHMLYLPQYIWQGPGNFTAKEYFWPEGKKSLREFSDRLRARGTLLGMHTGSMGFYMGDPILGGANMDDRISGWGKGVVASAVGEKDTEIQVTMAPGTELPAIMNSTFVGLYPPLFNRSWNFNWMQIGKELIKVGSFDNTDTQTWRLKDCERGVNGTKAQDYAPGIPAKGILVTYGTCFGPDVNSTLFNELADGMSSFLNDCGIWRTAFDALEFADYAGRYANAKWMLRVYKGMDHYVACESSSGLPQYEWHIGSFLNVGERMHKYAKGYFEDYLAGNCRYAENNFVPAALGEYPILTEANAWYATSPDDMEWWLTKTAGYDACYFLNVSIDDLRKHGESAELLSKTKAWEAARLAEAFTLEQRNAMKDFYQTYRLTTGTLEWKATPVGREIRYARANEAIENVGNPYQPQPLAFEARVLGNMKYDAAGNVPLLPANLAEMKIPSYLHIQSLDGSFDSLKAPQPASAKEKGAEKSKKVTAEDYQRIMGIAGVSAVAEHTSETSKTLATAARRQTIALTTANRTDKVGKSIQADWELPAPIDLSGNRALGAWVTGDGKGEYLFIEYKDSVMVRRYVVKIDFTGRRYVEIPSYKVSQDLYLDDLYRNWEGSWFATKLGFDFREIKRISVGFVGAPADSEVTCVLESPQALKEIPEDLKNLAIANGESKIAINGAVKTGEYVVYEGGATAKVLDENRHVLRELPVTLANWVKPSGLSSLQLSGEGTSPWIRVEFKTVGEGFTFKNPTKTVEKLYSQIK